MEIYSYEIDIIAEDSSLPAVWYLSSSVPSFVHLCYVYHIQHRLSMLMLVCVHFMMKTTLSTKSKMH